MNQSHPSAGDCSRTARCDGKAFPQSPLHGNHLVWRGVKNYVALQLITLGVAGAGGMWLFYLQHQFEDAHWAHSAEWDYAEAAFKGSSFYKLPKIAQWFSGNIGFHHIHHLSPHIPNYYLEKCHRSEPLFSAVKPVTFFASLKAITYRLWDEQHHKLVGYAALRSRVRK